jgi:Sortase and related acyltransferases
MEVYSLRPLRLPDDYEAIASVLSGYWSEPPTAQSLKADDDKLFEKGETWLDENGLLAGYDRERRVAVDESGGIAGYLWIWRAPWTERGYLNMTLAVDKTARGQGAGTLLLKHAADWAEQLGASRLLAEVWDDDPASLRFARHRSWEIERHAFQSVLPIGEGAEPSDAAGQPFPAPEELLRRHGLRLLTLADEPGEASERKLYEMETATHRDIPGYMGDTPDFAEWRKWNLLPEGCSPEHIYIAADGSRYVGIANMKHNRQTNGMYNEYTGVSRDYRGKGVALALKLAAIRAARQSGAAYIRTDNDSTNAPMLHVNRKLGYKPLRGSYRMIAKLHEVKKALSAP